MPDYEVIYLPIPAEYWSMASSVNDHGQVVGHIRYNTKDVRGFCWSEEEGLVAFQGDGHKTVPQQINNKGQIVGKLYHSPENVDLQISVFVREASGEIRIIPGLANGINLVAGINNHGQVAGVASNDKDDPDGTGSKTFVWDEVDGLKFLNNISFDGVQGTVIAQNFNDAGEVAGLVVNTETCRAFLWNESEGYAFIDCQTPVATLWALDNNGTVLGRFKNSHREIFLWSKEGAIETFKHLGDDSFTTCRMNDAGDIAGSGIKKGFIVFDKFRLSNPNHRAFLRKADGNILELSLLFNKNEEFSVRGINNDGWIVGSVSNKSDSTKGRAVLLKPK